MTHNNIFDILTMQHYSQKFFRRGSFVRYMANTSTPLRRVVLQLWECSMYRLVAPERGRHFMSEYWNEYLKEIADDGGFGTPTRYDDSLYDDENNTNNGYNYYDTGEENNDEPMEEYDEYFDKGIFAKISQPQ